MRLALTGSLGRAEAWSKVFYFCYYSASAALNPFLAVYYQSLGLAGGQIGLLTALPSLMMLVAAPLWGGLADARRQHRRLMLAAVLGVQLAALLLALTGTFGALVPVVLLYALFAAPIVPLMDNTVIDLLGERKDLYGRQRMWGAIGWGLAAPAAGGLAQAYGMRWPFWVFILLMGGVFLVSCFVPISRSRISTGYWSSLGTMLANRRWVVFLVVVFILGISGTLTSGYLLLYIGGLGGSKTLMGFALTVATVSELPMWFFANRLIDRFGARGILSLALVASALRMLVYSLIQAPGLLLVPQLLHGLTFSAMWAASVAYATQIAPPGLGATAQSLLSAVLFGLGGSVGSLLGGLMYQAIGLQTMYRWSGLVLLLVGVVFLLALRGRAPGRVEGG